MRPDLNKLLCERERYGSTKGFAETRHAKKQNLSIDGEEIGGRQGIKKRYGYETKSFSENLNPLFGAIRKAVGRKWDKFYSELCVTFDKRSVINQHILLHLENYIEYKNVYVEDGELWVKSSYSLPTKIRGSSVQYFVDPRDGIIKLNKFYCSHKAQNRERIAKATAEKKKSEFFVGTDLVLRKIDGVWYEFTLLNIPRTKTAIIQPRGVDGNPVDEFVVSPTWATKKTTKTWEELNLSEKKKFGRVVTGVSVIDLFTGERVYLDENATMLSSYNKYRHSDQYSNQNGLGYKDLRYHATKKTASHKTLKNAGLI